MPKLSTVIGDLEEEMTGLSADVITLKAQMQVILAQKRQLESLLSRWAREIQDSQLKADVMLYLFGDISCTEVIHEETDLDPPSFFCGIDPNRPVNSTSPRNSFNSPSPPLRRTMTCPNAPDRKRVKVDSETK